MTEQTRAIKDAMLACLAAGISVIPIRPTGDKEPCIKWRNGDRDFASVRALPYDVDQWIRSFPDCWMAIACGSGSNYLEVIDFDVPGKHLLLPGMHGVAPAYEPWRQLVFSDAPDLLDRLVIEQSVSGGIHCIYRCEQEIGRNQKLASRPATPDELQINPEEKIKGLIETRGQGGYFVCAPSLGYTLLQGSYSAVPVITAEERELMLVCARSLSEIVKADIHTPAYQPPKNVAYSGNEDALARAGDDFNARGTWEEILEPLGWAKAGIWNDGGVAYQLWRRPGKSKAWSARTGIGSKGDRFVNFSTSVDLPIEVPLHKFGLFTLLYCDGDFQKSPNELRLKGYGPQTPPRGKSVNEGVRKGVREAFQDADDDEPPPIEEEEKSPVMRELHELGAAERFVRQFGDDLRYCARWKRWFWWNGRHWEQDLHGGAKVAQCMVRFIRGFERDCFDIKVKDDRDKALKWVKDMKAGRCINSIIGIIARLPGIPIAPEELDRQPGKLNVRNGTVDQRTKEILAHDRNDLITQYIDIDYRPDVDCPLWINVLDRVLGQDEELMRYFWKAAGYSLLGSPTAKAFFFLYGEGDNGKSLVVEFLARIIGDYHRQTQAETFMASARPSDDGPSEAIARLKEARFVTSPELDEGKRFNESLIKAVTGRDAITCRRLYEESFEFHPQFVLWMHGNSKPQIRETTNAIWNRVKPIPFTVTIPKEEQDADLPEKLWLEREGVLSWLIDGGIKWQSEGLGTVESIEKATQSYRVESDVLGHFLEDETFANVGVCTQSSGMYESYKKWCKANNEFCMSQIKFSRAMAQRGWHTTRRMTGRYFEGLGLINDNTESTYPLSEVGTSGAD